MLYLREVTCIHSNLKVKMYFKSDVFLVGLNFSIIFFQGPSPLNTKIFSSRIWTNLKDDPENVKNRGIPRIRGTLTCLLTCVCSHPEPGADPPSVTYTVQTTGQY